jgi:hypothetical protein
MSSIMAVTTPRSAGSSLARGAASMPRVSPGGRRYSARKPACHLASRLSQDAPTNWRYGASATSSKWEDLGASGRRA